MSIRDEIKRRQNEGRLHLLKPVRRWEPIKRVILVTEELKGEIDPPMNRRFADLRADLDRFITGGMIEWTYLKPLRPTRDRVWAIRSVEPSPSIRVFGSFAARDIFIATHWERRSLLNDFKTAFKVQIRKTKAIWRQLFHPYSAHPGGSIYDYVSGPIANPDKYD